MRKYVVLFMPLAMLAALAGGCGGGGKKSVTVGDSKITTGGSLPADFPKDFPVYRGADFKGSVTATWRSQKGSASTWETGDSVDDVNSYYAEQLDGKSDWVQDSVASPRDDSFYSFHNKSGDEKQGFLHVARTDNKTVFVVFIRDA